MNEELVLQKVQEIFSPEEREAVIRALSDYGKEDYEREVHRVRLAILKKSHGRSSSVKDLVDIAKQDYRDVLAWAEYPEQMTTGATAFNTEENKLKKITESDRKQYLSWLNGS